MKIAQLAPLFESVPPQLYGGTERVVHYLTEELVRQGHEVTLYASGDSSTAARLKPQVPHALRLDPACADHLAHHLLMAERAVQEAGEYDVIHSHLDYLPFPLLRRIRTPVLTTLHGRLDMPDLVPLFLEFDETPVVSISHSQREPLPWINWRRTVYNGIDENAYALRERPGGYLAFLGRMSPEKGLLAAIEIARAGRMPLKIAAKLDPEDREFFSSRILPLFDDPLVTYCGEIDEREKSDFLGGAAALLFPIDWPEPFGMVMIEAMACGTPVIARSCGSVCEIVQEGVSGFIADTVDQALRALRQLPAFDRRACRAYFERRFTARRMAAEYLRLYRDLAGNGREEAAGYERFAD